MIEIKDEGGKTKAKKREKRARAGGKATSKKGFKEREHVHRSTLPLLPHPPSFSSNVQNFKNVRVAERVFDTTNGLTGDSSN